MSQIVSWHMFIKKRSIFDEMLQVELSLKNHHQSAYENS